MSVVGRRRRSEICGWGSRRERIVGGLKERRSAQSTTRSARMKKPSDNAREGNAALAGIGEEKIEGGK
jgi:hypothetical protein